ncbi:MULTISPECIES: PIN domain-containing protein [Sphingobium]|uniref:Ribonuclease VapC n=2 Tax=Sphingobium cupriresistens TaxID=1132417 RepID=A0A0J7XVE0_9SPHN|nr:MULTISPECIES: PIN domain-containing protein [Sphingobium]KMS55567.1 twitching motility protein PilT [Sphingobium cupriresistens LL01]MBJ7377695.1 PIN domain-containing protein [Sphingobium sp.]RYM07381.1 PIN domain-containing protein [Sphingobium cupriresistens]
MSGYSLDANIVIDALLNHEPAHREIFRIADSGARMWISRMAWIEILSKGNESAVRDVLMFLGQFGLDEIDDEISRRAAALRRERARLKSPDAIILATAQLRGRVLVTRNTKDFPAEMPGIRVPYTL